MGCAIGRRTQSVAASYWDECRSYTERWTADCTALNERPLSGELPCASNDRNWGASPPHPRAINQSGRKANSLFALGFGSFRLRKITQPAFCIVTDVDRDLEGQIRARVNVLIPSVFKGRLAQVPALHFQRAADLDQCVLIWLVCCPGDMAERGRDASFPARTRGKRSVVLRDLNAPALARDRPVSAGCCDVARCTAPPAVGTCRP